MQTPNGSFPGAIEAGESTEVSIENIGAAWYHNNQFDFAIFPTLYKFKINACCLTEKYFIRINNRMVNCGLGNYNPSDSVEISIESCSEE